jgi:hypothetical protein
MTDPTAVDFTNESAMDELVMDGWISSPGYMANVASGTLRMTYSDSGRTVNLW